MRKLLLRRATEEDTHMADPPPYPDSNSDTGDDTRVRPDRGSPPSIPRWVKVFGIIVIVLVLLVGIIVFTGIGGQHGPGRHTPSGDAGGNRSPSASQLTEHARGRFLFIL